MNTPLNEMRISECIYRYTARKEMKWARVWLEVEELVEAIQARDWENIKEETGDVLHFIQIWAFWQFSLDQKVWAITRPAVRKFAARKEVWKQIYFLAGLRWDLEGSCANYKRLGKVVKRLRHFGVPTMKAVEVYKLLIKPKIKK